MTIDHSFIEAINIDVLQDKSRQMLNDSGKNGQNVNAIKLYVEQGSFRFLWLVDKVKDQTVSDQQPH